MPKMHMPCDPACPEFAKFADALFNDPMTKAMGAPTDEIMEGFERAHRSKCSHCQNFGLANIEVV